MGVRLKGCQSREAGGLGSCWKGADKTRTKTAHIKRLSMDEEGEHTGTKKSQVSGPLVSCRFYCRGKKIK